MSDAMLTIFANGGVGALLVAALHIASKLIEKYKPVGERRAEAATLHSQEIQALTKRVLFFEAQVDKQQKDINDMRIELGRMSAERHYFYDAIVRCSMTHQTTADWWAAELETIRKKINPEGT